MFEPLTLPTTAPTPGYLHRPAQPNNIAVALTHGAGANCQSKLLIAVADALAAANFTVFRFDLPFRQLRPHGPPHPGTAAADREGIRQVAAQLKLFMKGSTPTSSHASSDAAQPRVILAGHSYGGRQASMLLAENPEAADALLLLSYPLHPPNKPDQLRTKHFPQITKPALFVQGTRDPFATIEELSSVLKEIPAGHQLLPIENAAHDLQPKKSPINIPAHIANTLETFARTMPRASADLGIHRWGDGRWRNFNQRWFLLAAVLTTLAPLLTIIWIAGVWSRGEISKLSITGILVGGIRDVVATNILAVPIIGYLMLKQVDIARLSGY